MATAKKKEFEFCTVITGPIAFSTESKVLEDPPELTKLLLDDWEIVYQSEIVNPDHYRLVYRLKKRILIGKTGFGFHYGN
jgi:hypothetical protein